MEWYEIVIIPLAVALLGLVGAQAVALLARRHESQQSARTTLIEPAHDFAAAALAALAALRHVTPPAHRVAPDRGHRNVRLLSDRDIREERLQSCRESIDAVRVARAGVRLAFHPKSWAAEYSRQTLAALRLCLESAEAFYALQDEVPDAWIETEGRSIRDAHKQHRMAAYQALDDFFEDVADRLRAPTWDPKKISQAEQSGPRWSGY
jgi:hypothetical protein